VATINREQLAAMNQHYQKFSFDYFLDCQQMSMFSNIELWCGASHFWLDSEGYGDCISLKKKLRSRNIKVVSVTSPSCAYQYQYAAMEPFHMERSRRYFSNGICVAHELEAKIAVVNSGWGYAGECEDDMWKRSAENLHALAERAKTLGVTLAMESLRNDESNIVNSLASAKKMFETINHPNLKIMVDTIATGAAGETLTQWFDTFGEDLVHMHFLDGNPYVHNAWGDGNTPLERQLSVMEKYGYTGYLVQEIADERYFADPLAADLKNMRVLERFLAD
jgi:protein FrlC